ncbi:Eco57I restriction-modification methylase domain-containing protein [Methanoplanus limicola]|uniref:site-specific DNA-methyltransferase (adenine-specific) n=1 Tax=Methanoplanus limicola DSM 2279 TaxID=937775 RepID=H1Z1M4_9EURY|nr:type I restriction-modification system subunit M [Methanoplanus limicola]EHQ34550.1 hypothetical protein Metlim_0411 [Methanoplanus limicola DSM 2279]
MAEDLSINSWYMELRQNGMLLSASVLDSFLPEGPGKISEYLYEKLRDSYTSYLTRISEDSSDSVILNKWLNAVFERFLDYKSSDWQKHTDIDEKFCVLESSFSGGKLKPDRVLLEDGNPEKPKFLVKIEKDAKRVGMGCGRASYSSFVELLRETGVHLGVLTNGRQFRIVYAGMDFDVWTEWEADRWFEDATGRTQLAGFRSIVGANGTQEKEGSLYPFYDAVLDSRTKQGELSQVLGEQTREAVEYLLQAYDESRRTNPGIDDLLLDRPGGNGRIDDSEAYNALYQASIRLVMRFVVTLFSEARSLLPVESDIYYNSYGLDGLYSQFRSTISAEGEGALEDQGHAWPRMLALFRLISEGCEYKDLTVPEYGGSLFRSGDLNSDDAVMRALALYEDQRVYISDFVVYKVLSLLKFGKVKAKVGRSTRWVSGPVDFSDLRTEYIGMMYEGLLDYHLRKVTDEEKAVIFLNIGKQPALPLSLLKSMQDKDIRELIKELSKEKVQDTGDESEEAIESEGYDEEGNLDDSDSEIIESQPEESITDNEVFREVFARVCHAVEVSKLVKKTQNKDETIYQTEVREKATQIIRKVVYPGQMYLIRGSGTRKGTGTFYTKPQLAVPTVHRTLEPLVYNIKGENAVKIPKLPDEILSLKICDPAMGSGSFPVSALRYLTGALYESLWHHKKIRGLSSGGTIIQLPFIDSDTGKNYEEFLPESTSDENFDLRALGRLKRHIAERCIYGVDLNPLAVELAKLSLWVETMDRQLPFTYLDHKLKCGNSLVGCWFDQFEEYPVMAWLREGGDKNHSNGVYYKKEEWTKAIKDTLNDKVKLQLIAHIEKTTSGQTGIENWTIDSKKGHSVHKNTLSLFESLHSIPIQETEEREKCYKERFIGDQDFKDLRHAFDRWCAVWFWPGDWLDEDGPTPVRFYNPTDKFSERVRIIAADNKFFHWEIEFPDVFVEGGGGFDAVIGNPPWEISKPKSQEFFSIYDPIYRTRTKQDAISLQEQLFERDEAIERSWLLYNSGFKSMSNWNKNAAFPFGDPQDENIGGSKFSFTRSPKKNKTNHDNWRKHRLNNHGYADPAHPFRHQGSADINTYKMFLEFSHALCREGGRIGMIVPSGIYTDYGTKELRELFLEKCQWEWIFCFENKKGIFDIHRSSKFCPVIIQKKGKTDVINVAFMRHNLSDWENPKNYSFQYPVDQLYVFSPESKSILETQTGRDMDIISEIYSNSVLLGDQGSEGWGINYAREFDMTNDSNLFPPLAWWEERGYTPDQYGRWLPPKENPPELIYKNKKIGEAGDIALPLYEGRMIGQFDFSEKGWVSGKGRSAKWRDIPWDKKVIEPQFLISNTCTHDNEDIRQANLRTVFMDVSFATNTRTMISAGIKGFPCGNKVPLLISCNSSETISISLVSILNSFVFDKQFRDRLGGLSLNYFIVEESALLKFKEYTHLIKYGSKIILSDITYANDWIKLLKLNYFDNSKHWKSLWAVTPHERLRLRCILDAVVAELYGISYEDFAWILRDCGHSPEYINKNSKEFDPKGFWRVDKTEDPEIRHTLLALKAYADLKKIGIDEFCKLNDGDGWMIPEETTFEVLKDGTIAFDTPGGVTVPVRERLGDRFYDWQFEGTPEESWAECEMHARNLLGDEEFEKMMNETEAEESPCNSGKEINKVLQKATSQKEVFDREEKKQKNLGDF